MEWKINYWRGKIDCTRCLVEDTWKFSGAHMRKLLRLSSKVWGSFLQFMSYLHFTKFNISFTHHFFYRNTWAQQIDLLTSESLHSSVGEGTASASQRSLGWIHWRHLKFFRCTYETIAEIVQQAWGSFLQFMAQFIEHQIAVQKVVGSNHGQTTGLRVLICNWGGSAAFLNDICKKISNSSLLR